MAGDDKHHRDADEMGDISARLRTLSGKIEAQRAARRKKDGGDNSSKSTFAGIGQALKLSSEFIGGVAVGAILGWLLDQWLGTTPWGMIVLLMLGFAAGVLNVLRSAGLIQTPEPGKRRVDENGSDGS
ncbi:AtpZ/AtpI family protein [Amorphus coralli]|uniref:AtpZ/AtpI family protein n=1 Tax=Amorphus coralli TaxID=340680 RepID=UPI000374FC67|nr:AtpZ/AtpI family protein [Amorphus coralli]